MSNGTCHFCTSKRPVPVTPHRLIIPQSVFRKLRLLPLQNFETDSQAAQAAKDYRRGQSKRRPAPGSQNLYCAVPWREAERHDTLNVINRGSITSVFQNYVVEFTGNVGK